MSARYGGGEVELVSADGSLPIHVVCRSSKKRFFLKLTFAAAMLLFAFNIDTMLPSYFLDGQEAWIRDNLPLLLAGVAIFLLLRGLLGLAVRKDIEIDGQTVSASTSYWLWTHRWREPLANYEGVRWSRYAIHEQRPESSSAHSRVRYRHVIELVHRNNAKRTVPLFAEETGRANAGAVLAFARKAFSASAGDATVRAELEQEAKGLGDEANAGNPRARWEGLATLLGVPAIDARDGSYEIREVGDLDKSVKELATEDRIATDWQGAAPPKSLQIEQRGDPEVPSSQAIVVTVHAAHLPKVVLYLLAGIGVVLGVSGVVTLDLGAFFGGLLFGGAAYGIWYLQRKNPHRLIISREEIRYEDPLVSSRSFVMPLQTIESIVIRDRDTESVESRKTLKLSGKELLISSDKSEHSAGGGLADDELEWLRDYLLTAIARA